MGTDPWSTDLVVAALRAMPCPAAPRDDGEEPTLSCKCDWRKSLANLLEQGRLWIEGFPVQKACNKCTLGTMTTENPHWAGNCSCQCHVASAKVAEPKRGA